MIGTMKSHLRTQLKEIEESGLYKRERIITSPQQARINVHTGETVLNAGQDAPPTMGMASEDVARRPINRATTI